MALLYVCGSGVIVQVDECKYRKRKYSRGHIFEGIRILGGVEITHEKNVFLSEFLKKKCKKP